jgi:hypothetical protein
MEKDCVNVTSCKHDCTLDYTSNDFYCSKCFIIHTNELSIRNENRERDRGNGNLSHFIPIWKREHDRGRFTKYTLEYLKGMYNDDINNWTWRFILQDIPEQFTWYEVHQVFRKNNVGIYWTGFGHYIGFKIGVTPNIVQWAEKFTDEKIGRYRINYMYLIYKFIQLEEKDSHLCRFIPLKGKLKWVTKMDEWWSKLCEKEKIPFIPTRIYKLKWNKAEQLQEIEAKIKLSAKDFQF